MSKVIITIGLVLVCGLAKADVVISNVLQKLPAMKQGVAYSLVDSKFNYLATTDIVQKNGFSLEVGYAGQAKNTGDKLVAVVSYEVVNAKKLGVTIPVLDLVDLRVGAYAGVGRVQISDNPGARGNNELDYGLSATAINIKF